MRVRLCSLVLPAVAILVLLWGLWGGSLLNSDDVIYADMARTAWKSGQWLDLRWQGAVLFEKPPLLFWLVGISGSLLGFSDLAVRLPGALAGLLALWLTARLGRELGLSRKVCRNAVWLLLGSTTFLFHTRRVLADPLLLAAMLAFLCAWLAAMRTGRSGAMAGVFLGLAILAKWVFVLLPLLAALGWHLVHRRWPRWRQVRQAFLATVIIAAPWHIMETLEHGREFWDVYLGYHVLARAGHSLVGAPDPLAYLRILMDLDPLFLTAATIGLLGLALPRGVDRKPALTPWLMAVLVLTPLQISATRMPHYLLCVVPLLALGAAAGWELLVPAILARAPVAIALLSWLLVASPRVLNADYSPTTKDACREAASSQPEETDAVGLWVVDSYNPAATWYCERPIPMDTSDRHFYAVQRLIDMMRRSGAVRLHTPQALDAMLATPPLRPILTRSGHGSMLLRALRRYNIFPGYTLEHHGDADLLLPKAVERHRQR